MVGSKNVPRGTSNWLRDYLVPNPIFPSKIFRRRFSVPRTLFERGLNELRTKTPEKWETLLIIGRREGKPGAVKLLSVLRVLCYGGRMDHWDEVSYISEETTRQ